MSRKAAISSAVVYTDGIRRRSKLTTVMYTARILEIAAETEVTFCDCSQRPSLAVFPTAARESRFAQDMRRLCSMP